MLRSVSLPPPPPPSPERGRLRGRLEGGLAGLCELHLLRQRHERRVRQALRLAAAGPPPPHADTEPEPEPDPEPDPLDFLPALLWELEQRVGGLRLRPETPSGDAPAWPGSGFYAGAHPAETPDSPPLPRQGQGPGERPKSVGDAGGASPRPTVPRSLSAPEHPLGAGGGLIPPSEAPPAFPSPGGAESYISRLLRRRARGPPLPPPRTSLAPEPGLSRQNSLRQRPPSERRGPERGASAPAPIGYEGGAAAAPRAWASWDERTPAPGGRASSPPQPRAAAAAACRRPPKLHTLRPAPADSGMVQARYIPARGARKKPPGLAKGRAVDLSLDRAPGRTAVPKKCRFAEERRGHRAARSQSENSLVGQGGPAPAAPAATRPTVARGGYRKWRSTAEICPEEGARGQRRGPVRPAMYAEAESDSEGSGGGGPSESSPSEAASPGSGSGSSDSEGSGGGLVWPQAPGPGRPNLFVKIKASHALKKKILRFRSGSLKVMTTV